MCPKTIENVLYKLYKEDYIIHVNFECVAGKYVSAQSVHFVFTQITSDGLRAVSSGVCGKVLKVCTFSLA